MPRCLIGLWSRRHSRQVFLKPRPIDWGCMLTMHGKACRTLKAAEELAKGVKHASAISLDVNNTGALEAEVEKHDLVIR